MATLNDITPPPQYPIPPLDDQWLDKLDRLAFETPQVPQDLSALKKQLDQKFGKPLVTTTDIRAPRQVRDPARNQPKTTVGPSATSTGVVAMVDAGTWAGIRAAFRQRRENFKSMKRQEHLAAKAAAGKLKPPNRWVYYPLISLAIGADVLGVVAQIPNLTGVGAFFVSAISFCLGVFFFFVGIFLSRKIKKTRNIGNEFSKKVSVIKKRVAFIRNTTARLVKLVRRSARGRSFLRTTWKRKTFEKTIKYVGKFSSWVSKIIRYGEAVLESIPFINAVPWFTINMILIYREHLAEYRQATADAAQYVPADAEEKEAFSEMEAVDIERIESSVAVA